ncbi:MAG: hypothetical protein AAF555_05500 [Verrucomicrobiota bacterium]
MKINLSELPEEGLSLEGETPAEVFDMPENDARPLSGIRYRFHVRRIENTVIAQGEFSACFQQDCGRCLDPFNRTIELSPHLADEEVGGEEILDLTERIRDDILLALPTFPRCEEADEVRECPAQGNFEIAAVGDIPLQEESTEGGPSSGNVWDALDGLEGTETESDR